MKRSAILLGFVGVAGCGGGASRASFTEPDASVEATAEDADASAGPRFTQDGEAGPAASSCSEAAKLVYVLSADNDLFSYAPDKTLFTKLGHLNCPTKVTPNSMAVDRAGTAWVSFADGTLFKVSTKDASCEATSFVPGQAGFLKFGMAFRSTAANPEDETLYVAANVAQPDVGLGTIDRTTLTLTPIGPFSGALRGQSAELTGTGDGRLLGFFQTKPVSTLATVDPTTGATSQDKALDRVTTGSAWAFSFWGGDFWFYTAASTTSNVTRYHASGDGSLEVVVKDVGMRIVGAGVSTCAPTSMPK